MSNLFSTVFRNFRSLLFDCTLNCRRSIHALPVSGKGSTYDSVLKRKRVVKDLNKPNFEVNKEGLKWTDWRMLRDVKRRYVCAEYYPVRLCLQTVYKNRFLPQIVRESAHKELNELPVNSRWTRLTNRCVITSRARGKLRRWRLSRIIWRHLADYNYLSGVQKSSWGP